VIAVIGTIILPMYYGYAGHPITAPVLIEFCTFMCGGQLYRQGHLAGVLSKVVFAVAAASIFPCYYLGQWFGTPS
jgi:hypothetical protein